MTFFIVTMICVARMQLRDCGPEPGFSRDVVSNWMKRRTYEAARKAHKGQRIARAKFQDALHETMRRELGL